MIRLVYECELGLRLGPVDVEFDARITYQAGRWQADVESIELLDDTTWVSVPVLIDLLEECPALYDALRHHATE